ncbi:uncharacterized protein B0I36DRAFT_343231 [Microdochium trichocladiopsis]|uniref:Uncharacterized protein n=1 Tax=Microdochium trichocladiopsis TaxID=1682393 RepID=A0A9P8XQH8_9PEZI|nr:uncharacterized protein B0I36DRAFT_343231 [Microdochium trichocladiopsis]KAH7007897.1 hypothetical protein B0I36DRAFT_343231 [Microdochium trichocladiopsis]
MIIPIINPRRARRGTVPSVQVQAHERQLGSDNQLERPTPRIEANSRSETCHFGPFSSIGCPWESPLSAAMARISGEFGGSDSVLPYGTGGTDLRHAVNELPSMMSRHHMRVVHGPWLARGSHPRADRCSSKSGRYVLHARNADVQCSKGPNHLWAIDFISTP